MGLVEQDLTSLGPYLSTFSSSQMLPVAVTIGSSARRAATPISSYEPRAILNPGDCASAILKGSPTGVPRSGSNRWPQRLTDVPGYDDTK